MTARGWASVAPLAFVLAGPSAAAAAPGRLVFEGAAHRPRVVTLERRRDGWSGRLTVVVRSDAHVKGHLRLRYFPARGEPVRIVGSPRDPSPVVQAARPRRQPVRLLPHQLLAVDLRFSVPRRDRLSAIDGTLVATLYDSPRDGAPSPALLEIRGALPTVRFTPAAVRLRVIRACWLFFGTCHAHADVTVRGDGVASLAPAGAALGSILLRNDDGSAARLRLVATRAHSQDGDEVGARLAATDFDGVGKLSGSVPLEPAPVGGPALPVEVTVGESLTVVVLAVFLGASLGGWLVQRAGVRRKRRLLELELRSALERYDDELEASRGKPKGYDLSGVIEPRPRPGVTIRPYPGKHGAASLIWHIRTAQDGPDFDAAIADTDDMVAQIDRWIGVERVARATSALFASEPPKRGDVPFTRRMAYRDTEELLATARRGAPPNDAAAEKLRRSLADAGLLLAQWKVLWELHRTLETAAAEQLRIRNALERDDLREQLREADEDEIERAAPPLEKRKEKDIIGLQLAVQRAATTVSEVIGELGIRPPETVQQRFDSATQLIEQLAEAAENPAIPRPTKRPDAVLTRRYLMQVLRDLLWTLVRATVAATIYALTIYDDTWGSALDFATAFTTGFASETIVNWAVMPALQSYRVRASRERQSDADVITQLQRALAEPADPGNGKGSPDEIGAGTPPT